MSGLKYKILEIHSTPVLQSFHLMEQEKNKPEKVKDDGFMTKGQLISFAYDVGFAIMIPLVILAVLGRLLDQKFGTSPLFLIAGLLLSLITTGFMIYKKTKSFMK